MSNDKDIAPDLRILEAILFASSEPMTKNALEERMPEGSDLGGLLDELRELYVKRGVNLIEREGSWAFRTAQDLADVLSVNKEVKRNLSRAAMETMAIIAYHQPVTRAEIENIRGVSTSKGTLDVLMEADWVKPGRRRDTPGRPMTWVTTTGFMDHFGLETMTDLPGLDDLKAAGLLDRRPAIETIPMTGELFDEDDEDAQREAEAEEEARELEELREIEADKAEVKEDSDSESGASHLDSDNETEYEEAEDELRKQQDA